MKKIRKTLRLLKFFLFLAMGKVKFENLKTEIFEGNVPSELHEQLYEIYLKAFERSKTRSVQAQICYDFKSFADALTDSDYIKYLLYEGAELIGLSLATKEIEKCSVAYAQPGYFRNRHPGYTRNNLLWYVTAIVVLPEKQAQKAGLFLLQTMVKHAYQNNAIIAFDFAGSTTFLPTLIKWAGRSVGVPIQGKKLDTQTYFELTCPHYDEPDSDLK